MKSNLRLMLCAVSLSCAVMPSIGLAGFDEGLAAFDKKDYATALREWRPLASNGDARAQFNLGVMYANGRGVPQDYKEAVKWYRLAADQGNAIAQSSLGVRYANGQGVVSSRVAAYALYNVSAASDPSDENRAAGHRARLAESMPTREIEAAQDLSREIAKPGNLLKALDRYVKNPALKE